MRDPDAELEEIAPKTGVKALWAFLRDRPELEEELYAFYRSAERKGVEFSKAYQAWASEYPKAPPYHSNIKTALKARLPDAEGSRSGN